MKAQTTSVGCALLVLVLVAACIPAAATGSRTRHAPRVSANARERQWRVGEPVKFENLTVYPVLPTGAFATLRFVTLDEGIRTGKVTVSEIGAGGRARRIRRGQEVSDDAEVDTLLVTNRSGKTLILVAGELVVGGNQDRMVGHDCLVEASARPAPIDVFCVEHGRWNDDSAFGQSRSDTIGASRSVASRRRRGRAGRGYNMGGGQPRLGGGSGAAAGNVSALGALPQLSLSPNISVSTAPGYFASSDGVMAAPNVREKAQAQKDQSAVWAEVANAAAANSTVSETGTLNQVYQDKKVRSNLDAYERGLKSLLPKNAVGVIAAINGEIMSADVFAAPSLFRAYWPKLLRSLALQATSSAERKSESPSLDQARMFLTRDRDRKGSTERKPQYMLVERKSDADASFELESSNKARSLIHFNKVAKN